MSSTATNASPALMTYEEFLDAVDEDTHAEWVKGEMVMTSPVSVEHQHVGSFLLRIVTEFVEHYQLGIVLYESFQMKTGPELPGREPDILFLAKENLSRLRETYLDGPADLAIEIISPESFTRDRGDKFREYEQGGVREYWMLDSQRRRAEFYRVGSDGFYVPVSPDADGVYRSEVLPGFWLKVDWLWQRPLPRLLEILKLWGLI